MAITLAIVTLTCNLNTPWIRFGNDGSICMDMLSRWQAVTILDLITEALLLLVSIIMVHPIQISPSLKGLIVLAFNQRILLVIPIVLRFHYITSAFLMPNSILMMTNVAICKEIEMVYAIVAATIPCLPRFVTAKETYDVHYAPSKVTSEQLNLSIGQKAVLKTKHSLANLRSLTPLFGSSPTPEEPGKTIRLLPVNVYDLDNTAAMMDTLPPREPPKLDMYDFAFPSQDQVERLDARPSTNDLDMKEYSGMRTGVHRYTIENADTPVGYFNRRFDGDLIAVAL